jgi:hypothetical protein
MELAAVPSHIHVGAGVLTCPSRAQLDSLELDSLEMNGRAD